MGRSYGDRLVGLVELEKCYHWPLAVAHAACQWVIYGGTVCRQACSLGRLSGCIRRAVRAYEGCAWCPTFCACWPLSGPAAATAVPAGCYAGAAFGQVRIPIHLHPCSFPVASMHAACLAPAHSQAPLLSVLAVHGWVAGTCLHVAQSSTWLAATSLLL